MKSFPTFCSDGAYYQISAPTTQRMKTDYSSITSKKCFQSNQLRQTYFTIRTQHYSSRTRDFSKNLWKTEKKQKKVFFSIVKHLLQQNPLPGGFCVFFFVSIHRSAQNHNINCTNTKNRYEISFPENCSLLNYSIQKQNRTFIHSHELELFFFLLSFLLVVGFFFFHYFVCRI